MDVADIEENRFLVKGLDFPFHLRVTHEAERKSIRFADYNRLHRVSEQEAAVICNEVNKQIVFGHFYALTLSDGAITVACEYGMTYERGLIPFQVIHNFRLFDKLAGLGVRNHFMDYLKS